jgi:hypothetical protein
MGLGGARPKPEGQAVTRHPKTHSYIEIPNRRYEGPVPALPDDVEWSERTRGWYGRVSRMPHAVLWDTGDWEYLVETAYIHHEFTRRAREGMSLAQTAAELRNRERNLGLTWEGRLTLRIRYVDVEGREIQGEDVQGDGHITHLDDYRAMYGDD